MSVYQKGQRRPAAASMAPPPSPHIRGPFCAMACELCGRVMLAGMGAGLFGGRPLRMPATMTRSRASAQAVTRSSALARTSSHMASAQSESPRQAKQILIRSARAQTSSGISKSAQRQLRSSHARPVPLSRQSAADSKKIVIKLRWSPVIIIPDIEAQNQRIRSGAKRLRLDPLWQEQKRREWLQNRAKFEHNEQDMEADDDDV